MPQTDILMTNRHLKDLNPVIAGFESCKSGHRFGPAVRKYTLLHYVVSGCGYYETGGTVYPVKKGEVFRILPGETTIYYADMEDPWTYRWIGFDGELSGKFVSLPPVFPLPPGAVSCFSFEANELSAPEYDFAARLFRLYTELFIRSDPQHSGNYVRRVQDYVNASFMKSVKVEEIAGWMNLDRRYLSRLFRCKTGQTIQEYLISVRMEEAMRCLSEGLSVSATAERCGYPDMFLFSKMFKRRFGISPANWKKTHEERPEEPAIRSLPQVPQDFTDTPQV